MSDLTIPGTNTLLMGPTGSGKTHVLGSIADSDIELFVLFVGENGLESLLRYWTDNGKKVPANVHWHVLPRVANSFGMLEDSARQILGSSVDALHKTQDYGKAKHNAFVKLLAALNDFPDDRTGAHFGSVAAWDASRCFALDSLTGVGDTAFSMVIGNKPVKSQTEWMVAQDQVYRLIGELCGCSCHFTLTAHVERETDEVFQMTKIMVHTLGKKLPPKIPRMFNDVILTERNGKSFYWSTASSLADVKAANLPVADKIVPGFGQLYKKWRTIQSTLKEIT